ncbi:hypothetical protein OO013_17910 [Mangrovivirga sp. M17]|uniref:DUF5017 domain-containing protein n=1 Tax=Mangrovivirga halotolerans TaxID=2993936 RepID=A0ABT3RVG5_9BACT|nr:hypothetical protein [Mangrovivirga halotolerans]MCX2745763.1 hypothetical protein [Mangrovivirga halotolerans]
MKYFNKYKIFFLSLFAISFVACEDESLKEQVTTTFGPEFNATIDESVGNNLNSKEVTVNFSRVIAGDAAINIDISSESIYGVNYITYPPMVEDGKLTLFAERGETSASFTVTSLHDEKYTGGNNLKFSLDQFNGELKSQAGGSFNLYINDADVPELLTTFTFNEYGNFETPDFPFMVKTVPGFKTDRGWQTRAFFGFDETTGLQASAYGGNPGADNSWLILNLNDVVKDSNSENINTSSLEALVLSMMIESYYDGSGELELKYSTDFDSEAENPEDFTWTTVESFSQNLPEKGSGSANAPDGYWKKVTADLSEAAGSETLYIAFHFYNASSANSVSYTIDNLEIRGE